MVTTKSSNVNWSSCSLQDLVSISYQVVKVLPQRKSESSLESIQRLTKGIQTECNSLAGDSSTYREVHILESLDLDRIAEEIKSIDDEGIINETAVEFYRIKFHDLGLFVVAIVYSCIHTS